MNDEFSQSDYNVTLRPEAIKREGSIESIGTGCLVGCTGCSPPIGEGEKTPEECHEKIQATARSQTTTTRHHRSHCRRAHGLGSAAYGHRIAGLEARARRAQLQRTVWSAISSTLARTGNYAPSDAPAPCIKASKHCFLPSSLRRVCKEKKQISTSFSLSCRHCERRQRRTRSLARRPANQPPSAFAPSC